MYHSIYEDTWPVLQMARFAGIFSVRVNRRKVAIAPKNDNGHRNEIVDHIDLSFQLSLFYIFFLILYSAAYWTLATIFSMVLVTLSPTLTDLVGASARIFCDLILPYIIYLCSIKNTPKV